MGLAAIGDLAAQTSQIGYKALVCIFLHGGNDHNNTLIPCDAANYNKYATIRGGSAGVALPWDQVSSGALNHPADQVLKDDIRYALPPSMPNLRARFNDGTAAALLNVGPLVAPITKAQFETGNTRTYPRPEKLFSHNDQQATWQSFGTERERSGWGGKLGELMLSANTNTMFTAISAGGNAVFTNGTTNGAVNLSPSGPAIIYPAAGSPALVALLKQQSQNILQSDYARLNDRSIKYAQFLQDIIKGAPNYTQFGTGGRSVAAQLSLVARLISARQQVGTSRQIFFVSMGGFDTHDNLKVKHQGLLAELDEAIGKFYAALVQLGVQDAVTTFTASDFGRTLTFNGDGTDHGWGAHHFVVGGSVKGGRYYGVSPSVSVSSDDQVGRGRLLPTTSVDEYASTLALWFGLPTSYLHHVAPNIGRFANPNLGFMKM